MLLLLSPQATTWAVALDPGRTHKTALPACPAPFQPQLGRARLHHNADRLPDRQGALERASADGRRTLPSPAAPPCSNCRRLPRMQATLGGQRLRASAPAASRAVSPRAPALPRAWSGAHALAGGQRQLDRADRGRKGGALVPAAHAGAACPRPACTPRHAVAWGSGSRSPGSQCGSHRGPASPTTAHLPSPPATAGRAASALCV